VKTAEQDAARNDGRKKASDKQVAEALMAGWGNPAGTIAFLQKTFNVHYTRSGLWRRVEASPKLKAALAEARTFGNEKAEARLIQAVIKGEPWAIKFWLEHNNPKYRPEVVPGSASAVPPPRSAEELKAEAAKYGIHFDPDAEGLASINGPDEADAPPSDEEDSDNG
jgi:hypothetical protein